MQRVTEMLAVLPATAITASANIAADDVPASSNIAYVSPSRRRLLELLHLRKTRQHFFDDKLFADPVLHMLLDLMEHRLHNPQISVSSLYQSCGVPITTAIRRLDDLEQVGFIARWEDPKGGRRQLVKLTPKAAEKPTAYLYAIDWQLR